MDGEIAPEEVQRLVEADADGLRVVDVRSPAAFERGHVPGSENVPFAELPDCVEDLADADRVVTVCPHGKASVQAARLVTSFEGTDARVESMAGGLDAWPGDLVAGGGHAGDAGDAADAPF